MKPFRKNLALAIDGGGIKGVIVTKALTIVEEKLGYPLHARAGLTAGTSTGSIIAAGLAAGLEAKALNELYLELGSTIFHRSIRTWLWPLFNYRYSNRPLRRALDKYLGNKMVAELWKAGHPIDVVITTFDIVESRTRFIKPYKSNYADWPVVQAVLASAAAPTYFPSIDGRYVDGGVGSYGNPCYLAAYEIAFALRWKLEDTTLISIGTGRDPNTIRPGEVNHFLPLRYITPILGAFQTSAADQQVDLVNRLFERLDFRRFQVDLKSAIPMDDPSNIPALLHYGEELGRMILSDITDRAMSITPQSIPGLTGSTSRRQTNKSGSPRAARSRMQSISARARRKR
ncbi:MAG TPA: patatin-like phospholipase family protein [Anaerolineales bacterium]|nr:patatin-like phospholipase family protein [Anaerolineales bacterium]